MRPGSDFRRFLLHNFGTIGPTKYLKYVLEISDLAQDMIFYHFSRNLKAYSHNQRKTERRHWHILSLCSKFFFYEIRPAVQKACFCDPFHVRTKPPIKKYDKICQLEEGLPFLLHTNSKLYVQGQQQESEKRQNPRRHPRILNSIGPKQSTLITTKQCSC